MITKEPLLFVYVFKNVLRHTILRNYDIGELPEMTALQNKVLRISQNQYGRVQDFRCQLYFAK